MVEWGWWKRRWWWWWWRFGYGRVVDECLGGMRIDLNQSEGFRKLQ